MKRKILLFIAAYCASTMLFAVPARKNTLREVVLTDGTVAQVALHGDEYSHWWADAEGHCYTIDSEGYATLLSAADVETLRSRGAARKEERNARRVQHLSSQTSHKAAYTSTKRGLIILVNFLNKDMCGTTPQNEFDRMFNEEGYSDNGHIGSVADYFYDQSYGQFAIDFDVVGPVTVAQNYAYYGQNDRNGNDLYPCTMVIEACRLVDEEVDFSQYDWDDDGEVEQVFIVYAGYGENNGASSDTIWPHEWELSSGKAYGDGEGAITLDGVTINTYAVTCELAGTTGTTYAGIGTACHEFSHCLGLPDVYDASYSGGWGMEGWDLLDCGSYSGPRYNGEVPTGYTSYERWAAGWMEPTILTNDMVVEALAPLNDTPTAYILYNDAYNDEYYLLENRHSDRWFSYVEGYVAPSGLLILHIDYNNIAWANNTVNNNVDHQRMTIFQANNQKGTYNSRYSYYIITEEQYQGHVYPYNDNDSLTASSTPAAEVYNISPNGTLYMDKGIYDITRHSDNTISFRCHTTATDNDNNDNNDNPSTPDDEEEVLFYESFDQCSGKGGNDDLWSGFSSRAPLLPDNEGWGGTSCCYGGYQCARYGDSTYPAGWAVSPEIPIDGTATITFKIGIWDLASEPDAVDIHLSGAVLSNSKVITKGEWTELSYTVSTCANVTLEISSEGRFFLDEVKVTANKETAGIREIPLSNDTPYIYNLSGQPCGTSFEALPAGVYIRNGKKIIKR